MKAILDPEHRAVLEKFAEVGSALVFDYDGTLAPITRNPANAVMRPSTRELLAELGRTHTLAVISGRARGDVLKFLHGIPVAEVIGNHGEEDALASQGPAPRGVQDWRKQIENRLRKIPGVILEDKGFSLSVHYRQAPDAHHALERVLLAVAQLEGARLLGGKAVLNIVPQGSAHKGAALERLRAQFGSPRTLFVGDDQTDEDAFLHLHGRDFLGVRVGYDPSSAADYFVPSQSEVDELLGLLRGAHRCT